MIVERVKADTAARMLGVSPRHVKDLAASGELPGAAKIGARWTFDPDKLQSYLTEREAQCLKKQNISTREARSGGSKSRSTREKYAKALRQTIWELRGKSATNA